jgi:transketolase
LPPASSPCPARDVFDRQPRPYRQQVLPPTMPTIAIEAGHPDLWWKYVGTSGAVIGIDRFGESAPAAELYEFFGINVREYRRAGAIDCSGRYRPR